MGLSDVFSWLDRGFGKQNHFNAQESYPLVARLLFPLLEQDWGRTDIEAESVSDSALIPQKIGKGLCGGGPSLGICGSIVQCHCGECEGRGKPEKQLLVMSLGPWPWPHGKFYILCHWKLGDSWIRGRISVSLISIIRNYLILLEMESKSDQKDGHGMCVWRYVRACVCVCVVRFMCEAVRVWESVCTCECVYMSVNVYVWL